MPEVQEVLDRRRGCRSLVDPHEVEVRGCRRVAAGRRVDDHRRQAALARGLDERVLADQRVEDEPVDGGAMDRRAVRGALLRVGGNDDQRQLLRVGGVRDTLEESHSCGVVERIGQALSQDDADRAGAAAPQVARGGIGSGVAQL